VPPADVNPYGMDDNLHMHDLKHKMVGGEKDANKNAGDSKGDKQ
jgi:C4-dicarboxylate transporter DctQ subunit